MIRRKETPPTPPTSATQRTDTYWNAPRLARVEKILLKRADTLRAEIERELCKHDDERVALLAGNVADSAELSNADLIGDLDLAEIDRDVRELQDVERALTRLVSGSYGRCIDCGQAIDPIRLEFNPQAARCLRCQESAERTFGDRKSATL